jgi:hypothetical protein
MYTKSVSTKPSMTRALHPVRRLRPRVTEFIGARLELRHRRAAQLDGWTAVDGQGWIVGGAPKLHPVYKRG